MPNMVGAHHCNAPRIKARRHTLVTPRMLSEAMHEQYAGPRIVNRPVSILNAAFKTFHIALLRVAPKHPMKPP